MAGRKEFLLGNVPNRISHNARCTVIIVNTTDGVGHAVHTPTSPTVIRSGAPEVETQPHLMARGTKIATVFAKHGLKELFGRPDQEGAVGRQRQAKRMREAFEELGPTFCKLGQILSTRPDLLGPEFIAELSQLQDNVPPLSEEQVVKVMEQELGVPWEDVFDHIEPAPLAAGTIAQVHRAVLANAEPVVVKVQRPDAKEQIEQDLALLEVFAEKVGNRDQLKQVIDMEAVFEHLSTSLHRELDFRQEARNMERLRDIVAPFSRLAVPVLYPDYSTSRLLVMRDVGGGPDLHGAGGPDPPRGRRATPGVLLQAGDGGRVLPRRPAPGEPDVAAGGGPPLLPGSRHGWRGRRRDARAHDVAADGLLAGGRRVPRRHLADAVGRDRPQRPRRRRVPGRDRRDHGEVSRRVAAGHPARPGVAGDDRDLPAARGPPAVVAGADREGAGADATGGHAAGSRGRSVRRRRPVPDAQRHAGHGREGRSEGALLSGAAAEGPVPAPRGSARAPGRGATGSRSSRSTSARSPSSRRSAARGGGWPSASSPPRPCSARRSSPRRTVWRRGSRGSSAASASSSRSAWSPI